MQRFNRTIFKYETSSIPASHQECYDGKVPNVFHETATVELLYETHSQFNVAHAAAVCGNVEALRAISTLAPKLFGQDSSLSLVHALALGGCPASYFEEFASDTRALKLRTPLGLTPLHCAALSGQIHTIEHLLSNGAQIDERDYYRRTVLMCAARGGSVEAIKYLVEKGASIDEKGPFASTILMAAAEGGSVEAIRYLVENGASIGEKDRFGSTALMYAARGGSVEAIKYLLENGSSIGEKNNKGSTALVYAADGGNCEAMKFVIASGARIDEEKPLGLFRIVPRTMLDDIKGHEEREALELLREELEVLSVAAWV